MARVVRTGCLIAVIVLGAVGVAVANDAVVGTGTPASCTEAAFTTALATAHLGGAGTMTFNCGTAAILFTSQKAITGNITIDGAQAITISGGNSTRLFDVQANAALTLRRVALTNGFANADGGAITSTGSVVIENSTIRNSRTDNLHSGGAIVSYGPLTITGSLLEGNTGGGGGAVYVRFEAGDAVITNSTLRDNRAINTTSGWGGGILVWDGADVTLHGATVANNQAQRGGGIHNAFTNSTVIVDGGSVISGNSATEPDVAAVSLGGGMYTAGTLSLLDSTVSGNHAGAGGGVYSLGTASVIGATLSGNSATYGGGFVHSGTSTITNTTFGANIAPVGGGLQVNSFGATLTNVTFQANSNGIWTGYAQVTLRNTVLAGSTSGPNCSGYPEAGIVSQGFNLSSDNSCAYLTQPGDRTGVNPLLGPLANNGGPTLTHLPAATSPAVDGGTPVGAPALDQRGQPRPSGLAMDIGAVERQPGDDPPTTVQAPTDLRVSAVAGNLVTFRFSPNPLGPSATGFLLEGGAAPGAVQAVVPTGSAVPLFSIAVPTGSFFVRMRATRGADTSAPSNEVPIHVNVPVAPSAPDRFGAVVSGDGLALSWRNTFAGGSPAGATLDVTGTFTTQIPLGPGETYGVNGAPPGTYTLRLRSVNASGSSPLSAPVTVSIPATCSGAPTAPSSLLAYRVGNTVSVIWDPPASGAAASSYVVAVSGSFVGSFATPARSLSGQVAPGSYTVSVQAVNMCGASAATGPQTVVVP